jgi:hypothetical protein
LSLARASSFWWEQESSGILRNPEESGVNTGITVPQEFLRKFSVKPKKKQELLRPPPKPRSCEKFLRKTQGRKIPQESCQERFFGSKK